MLVASMTERPAHDYGLESLLAMDGVVFVLDHGHWIKIEARVVVSNRHVPHGVRCSRTLHEVFEYQFESAENFWLIFAMMDMKCCLE